MPMRVCGMNCKRWGGVILLVALLPALPVYGGTGKGTDLRPLLSGPEGMNIAANTTTAEPPRRPTTEELNNGGKQTRAAEKRESAAGNRPIDTLEIEQEDTLVI